MERLWRKKRIESADDKRNGVRGDIPSRGHTKQKDRLEWKDVETVWQEGNNVKVRKYEGGEVQQIRLMHKGKGIVFQHMVKSQAAYYIEDTPELIKNRIEIEFNDICEMDAMIDMLIRAEEHLLGEMGKWKVKSINEEEYTRRMERLRRML